MRDPTLGGAFAKRVRGTLAGSPVEVALRVDVRAVDRFASERSGELVGVLDHARLGRGLLARTGRFRLQGRRQVYELRFDHAGREVTLELDGRDARLAEGEEVAAGTLTPSLGRRVRYLLSFQATGADSLGSRIHAVWLLMRLIVLGR